MTLPPALLLPLGSGVWLLFGLAAGGERGSIPGSIHSFSSGRVGPSSIFRSIGSLVYNKLCTTLILEAAALLVILLYDGR
ncbi:uncharacterized protein GGS25DRAFT_501919 [Hypoxylon fragiforme]|uniref:uncharacterized protein n=1 Tax=Hypoxylon fragiforme TaxID=63214 RepID=UPI0020C6B489|nr:uncharacterized protein GGS25DRAFT_501919 [Hypoxylon fragiforme]KAI2604767.1 hypothetical protein GGS25DRAFT_501919 [Hypoxylon fragiforme]